MNMRTGWNRRGLQSRNPALEALEARLVLSEAARSGLQPLLSHAQQLGKPVNPGVTIDSVVAAGNPKADLPFLNANVLLGNTGSTPASGHYLSQGSLTEGQAGIVQPPISQSIEASVVGVDPSEATQVAKALEAFGLQASAAVGEQVATSTHATAASSPRHNPAAPAETAPARGGEANAPSQTADAANSGTGQPTERTTPPDRAVPEPTNANVGLAQAAAEMEQAAGAPSASPSQSTETMTRQGAPPLTGQTVSYLVNSSRFIDGNAPELRIHESQELPAADLGALPIDESTQSGMQSPADRLTLLSEEDVEVPPAPLSGDLILNFLPCNVTALRTAVENLLSKSEQVLESGAHREGPAFGLLIAALVTSGMAGHAAWERARGGREETGSVDWLDGWALTRRLAVGLQLSEMP
jgi:hypothetical protein